MGCYGGGLWTGALQCVHPLALQNYFYDCVGVKSQKTEIWKPWSGNLNETVIRFRLFCWKCAESCWLESWNPDPVHFCWRQPKTAWFRPYNPRCEALPGFLLWRAVVFPLLMFYNQIWCFERHFWCLMFCRQIRCWAGCCCYPHFFSF